MWLTQEQGDIMLTLDNRSQVSFLLLLGAVFKQFSHEGERNTSDLIADRTVAIRQFFDHHRPGYNSAARAAPFWWRTDAVKAKGSQAFPDVPRHRFFFVPFEDIGNN